MSPLFQDALDQLVDVGLLDAADVAGAKADTATSRIDDVTQLRFVLTQIAGQMRFGRDLDGLAVQVHIRDTPAAHQVYRWQRWLPGLDLLDVPAGHRGLLEAALLQIERRLGLAPDLRLRLRDGPSLDVVVAEGEETEAEFAEQVLVEAWKRSVSTCEVCGMPGEAMRIGLRRAIACPLHAESLHTLPLPPAHRVSSGEVAAVLALTVADDPAPVTVETLDASGRLLTVRIEGWAVQFDCSGSYPVDTVCARDPTGRTGTIEHWAGLEAGDPLHLLGSLRDDVAARLHEIAQGSRT